LRVETTTGYDAGASPPRPPLPLPMTTSPSNSSHAALEALAAARSRIAIGITVAMTVIYVGFILLVAFNKAWLGSLLAPGLSLGIVLGVLVILSAWVLNVAYVRWANSHYDHRVASIRGDRR
jgi:uncharacterized membrane protein (DUF485 family)